MKIAVACNNQMIAEHFGHCEEYLVFEVKDKEIIKSEVVSNPGHKPRFLPNFLNKLGVNVIISGGMGGKAIDLFNEKNIEVIVGASGEAKKAVEAYLQGSLESTGSICRQHQHRHHGECGECDS
ncbi:MAG: dinitrogenase iron-molybdenum cofactor [Firmicutes bacterium]|nr:dinitrogenase iron-molybdenum cofactor [Bacillota bacterium]